MSPGSGTRALCLACGLLALAAACAAADALPPVEELCPGFFEFELNASYWDFNGVGLWSPEKKRSRDPVEASRWAGGVLEQAAPELMVLQMNTSMPVVGYWQVTEAALSTGEGRSLSDPSKQYPWTGGATLTSTDALGDMDMPLGGGSLPEPGTEGSVFKSPLFVTVSIPGPTEEALAIAQAAEPQYVNNRKYGAHGIPLQDTLAPHQRLFCEGTNVTLLLTNNDALPPAFKPRPEGLKISTLQDVTALNPALDHLFGLEPGSPPVPVNTTTHVLRRIYWANLVEGAFVSSTQVATKFASLEDARASINPLGPSMIYTGLESPTRSPGQPPEVYANDPELVAAARADFAVALTRLQASLRKEVFGDDAGNY